MEKSDILLNSKSDLQYIHQIGEFIQHSRLIQNLTQGDLAEKAGLNRSTVVQIENGMPITLVSLIQLLRALNKLEVFNAMVVQQQISPLQMAKMEVKKRKRVSANHPNKSKPKSDW